jgi:hypothetical protein
LTIKEVPKREKVVPKIRDTKTNPEGVVEVVHAVAGEVNSLYKRAGTHKILKKVNNTLRNPNNTPLKSQLQISQVREAEVRALEEREAHNNSKINTLRNSSPLQRAKASPILVVKILLKTMHRLSNSLHSKDSSSLFILILRDHLHFLNIK